MANNERAAAENQYPAWHKHVDYILGENPRRVRGQAVMRRGGMPVWAVMRSYFACEQDKAKTLRSHGDTLTAGELEATLSFYLDHPEEINRKLWEIANDGEFPPGWTAGRVKMAGSERRTLEKQAGPWEKYIDEYSRRSAPVIRDKGMSVWSVVGYYLLYGKDKCRTLAIYDGRITIDELDAVLDYYREKPESINRKLWEIAN